MVAWEADLLARKSCYLAYVKVNYPRARVSYLSRAPCDDGMSRRISTGKATTHRLALAAGRPDNVVRGCQPPPHPLAFRIRRQPCRDTGSPLRVGWVAERPAPHRFRRERCGQWRGLRRAATAPSAPPCSSRCTVSVEATSFAAAGSGSGSIHLCNLADHTLPAGSQRFSRSFHTIPARVVMPPPCVELHAAKSIADAAGTMLHQAVSRHNRTCLGAGASVHPRYNDTRCDPHQSGWQAGARPWRLLQPIRSGRTSH